MPLAVVDVVPLKLPVTVALEDAVKETVILGDEETVVVIVRVIAEDFDTDGEVDSETEEAEVAVPQIKSKGPQLNASAHCKNVVWQASAKYCKQLLRSALQAAGSMSTEPDVADTIAEGDGLTVRVGSRVLKAG